ncbi:phage holin family protein [Enterobacter hormaechei]|nr:phage holin family protein [Enterobacter hormaechei]MCE1453165.1 phage holin family protein [Enterobacter hormaechei]
MSHTLTTESLNQGLSLSALMSVVAGVPPEVALGALAGAVIFVTSAVEYPIKRRLLLAFISFFCGLLFYKPTATLLIGFSSVFPGITIDMFEKGVAYSAGAFVSSIVAVGIGTWLYHRSGNPRDLIPGRKDDDRS